MSTENSEVLRRINILSGSILIVLAVMILVFPDLTLITLLLMISTAILILGISRVINASRNETLAPKIKILKFVTGQ